MKVTKEQFVDATYDELLAENDRLVVKLNAEHIHRQNVEAENDKLRELVQDMWHSRDALSYGAAIPTLERMHALGIEVEP